MKETFFAMASRLLGAGHVVDESPAPGSNVLRVCPASAFELEKFLASARAYDAPRPAIRVDLGRMTKVLEVNPTSLLCRVEAGATLGAIEARLRKESLTLGRCSLHLMAMPLGSVLEGALRPLEAAGTFEARVIGLEGVLPDGGMFSDRIAPRRAAGPDLSRVFVGSAGQYGILTAAILRVARLPEHVDTLALDFAKEDLEGVLRTVRTLLVRGSRPARVTIHPKATGIVLECVFEGLFAWVKLERDLWTRSFAQAKTFEARAEMEFTTPVPELVVAAPLADVFHLYKAVAAEDSRLQATISGFSRQGAAIEWTGFADPLARAHAEKRARSAKGRVLTADAPDPTVDAYHRTLREKLDSQGLLLSSRPAPIVSAEKVI